MEMPRIGRIARVPFLCCCLFAFAAPAADVTFRVGDAAGPIRPLLGVNAGPMACGEPGNADVTGAYRQVGVHSVRTHDYYGPLDMAVLYPDRTKDPSDPASYNFTQSDAHYAKILDAGFEVFFRLGDSWNNAKPPVGTQERANWAAAAVEVLRHYREGQWNGFVSGFRYAEIWNEPDNAQFWPAPRTREEFYDLYVRTAQALRAAFPGLKVGGPGVTPAGALAPQGRDWTRAFLDRVKAAGAPLDFFSWHLYTNEPSEYDNVAAFYRAELDVRGYTAVESVNTEYNTDINHSGVDPETALELRCHGLGAAINTAGWIALQENGVTEATFYRGNDPNIALPQFYGLFYADGRPKKIALAFRLWSETVAACTDRLAVSVVDGSAPAFRLLAGRAATGAPLVFLAANPGDAAVDWAAEPPWGGTLADCALELQTVSDAAEGIVTTLPYGAEVSVPGRAVIRLTAVLRGDVSLDGVVSIADACLLAAGLAGSIILPPAGVLAADVDADGRTDAADLVVLLGKLN
ncbi:MAG: hypothetical protein KA419_14425 [Acidobacteria bacterium]|nr:hypothetical protein [Acidobacteriota bacterium]